MLHLRFVRNIAAGQQRQRAEAERSPEKIAASDGCDQLAVFMQQGLRDPRGRPVCGRRIAAQAHGCSAALAGFGARPVSIASKVRGTSSASATWTMMNSTIALMPAKWTMRAPWKLPHS